MEHRKEQRMPLLMYLDVLERQSQKNLGHLGDVSTDGMMLITHQAVDSGQDFNISIQLPESSLLGLTEARTIDLSVQTLWKKPNFNPALSCIGCRFTQITDADRALLQQIGAILGLPGDTDVQVSRVNA